MWLIHDTQDTGKLFCSTYKNISQKEMKVVINE